MLLGRCLVWVILLCLAAPQARAEWYTGGYLGGAVTDRTDRTQESTLGGIAIDHGFKVDPSFTMGVRGGYWLDTLPWFGMGLDIFYFRAKAPTQRVPVTIGGAPRGSASDSFDIAVLGIGFDVLRLRAPLLSSDLFPHGQLQPYLTAGPAVFVSQATGPSRFIPPSTIKTDAALGMKIGAGLDYQISQVLGVFAEYRYTHFKTEHAFRDDTPPPSTETFKSTLDTHHFIIGVSVHLD